MGSPSSLRSPSSPAAGVTHLDGEDRGRCLGLHLRAQRGRRDRVHVLPHRLLPVASARGVRRAGLPRVFAERSGPRDPATRDRAAAIRARVLLAAVSPRDELELDLATTVELLFEGDLFETEDQRNWTDASFKTYCTPQELGFPFAAEPGNGFVRSHLPGRLRAGSGAAAPAGPLGRTAHRLELTGSSGERSSDRLRAPARHRPPLRRRTRATARRATRSPARGAGTGRRRLAVVWRAAATAEALGCPSRSPPLSRRPCTRPAARRARFAAGTRVLRFDYEQEMSVPAMTRYARERIVEHGARVPVIGGTDLWFAELNRARPDLGAIDGLAIRSPRRFTRSTRDRSLIPGGSAGNRATARPSLTASHCRQPGHFAAARWFSQTTSSPTTQAETLPFSVDPRQSSLFAAAWTVGSIAALADAGAAA